MEFVNTFWALVPPIVAIVLALITKETYSSLFIGILVGALFVSGFSPVGTLDAMIAVCHLRPRRSDLHRRLLQLPDRRLGHASADR